MSIRKRPMPIAAQASRLPVPLPPKLIRGRGHKIALDSINEAQNDSLFRFQGPGFVGIVLIRASLEGGARAGGGGTGGLLRQKNPNLQCACPLCVDVVVLYIASLSPEPFLAIG